MTTIKKAVLGSLVAAALTATAGGAAAADWPHYGNDQSNTRYSALDQINTGNIGNLMAVWAYSLGTADSQESTPIVVGDTMYVTSSTGPRYVFALDAKTGAKKWAYQPELPNDFMATVCCGLDNRGVAVHDGKVFVGRLDAKMDALDA